MPYVMYKGSLLSLEDYEKLKDEIDSREKEYLKLILGEEGVKEVEEVEGAHEEVKEEVQEVKEEVQVEESSSTTGETQPQEAQTQDSDLKTTRRRRSR